LSDTRQRADVCPIRAMPIPARYAYAFRGPMIFLSTAAWRLGHSGLPGSPYDSSPAEARAYKAVQSPWKRMVW